MELKVLPILSTKYADLAGYILLTRSVIQLQFYIVRGKDTPGDPYNPAKFQSCVTGSDINGVVVTSRVPTRTSISQHLILVYLQVTSLFIRRHPSS